MSENVVVRGKASQFEYWLNKPVAVQFRGPYVPCRDGGMVRVKCADAEGKTQFYEYGSPVFMLGQQDAAMLGLVGQLLEDPGCADRLIVRYSATVDGTSITSEVGVDPDMIMFITVIPEHKAPSRLVT